MKRLLIILIFLFTLSCCKLFGQFTRDESMYKFPLKTITVYCLSDTSHYYSQLIFNYDESRRLVSYSSVRDKNFFKSANYDQREEKLRAKYNYDEKGLLISKDFYDEDGKKVRLTKKFEYDADRMAVDETYKEYPNESTTYFYSRDRQLIRIEGRYTDISYEYADGKLVKESSYSKPRFTYTYNPDETLKERLEYGKVIEAYNYINGRLVRTQIYDAPDPGFLECDSQFDIRYDYY